MDTDRNLLFGVLALQADAICRSHFLEACAVWAHQKDRSLADLLLERGWITPEDRADIDRVVARKLKKHSGDARAGLVEVTTDEVRQSLAEVDDADVRRTLGEALRPQGPGPVSTADSLPGRGGRYVLSRLHAKGGIGQVWLARDSSLGRDVALKELRPDRAHQPALRIRFLREAQVTGQLEHPGIVPIYELGTKPTDDEPFYTMRFVRGRTLTEALRAYHGRRQRGEAGPLEFRDLLAAFVSVCNAVAYAHSRGVLHRDLKPQNVALGDFGEVMVLDWGLAKLTDQPDDTTAAAPLTVEEGGEGTQAGQVLGTPAYLSPEQADGRLDLLDARTDVYGLSAILYELLAGRPPFTGTGSLEVLQQVRHEPPTRPRALVPAVPAALEAVCLKALAKDRSARYASARELASEVQHFLADEPVTAYRESVAVRLARWGRRHKPLVTGATALLATAVVLLTIGAGLLGQANARTERQREAAEKERDRAEDNFRKARQAVDDYFTQVSEDRLLQSPLPGLQPLRKELLETALKYYREFATQHRDDPALQAELAQALVRVGKITNEIGQYDDAHTAFQEAGTIWRQLVRDDPDRVEYQRGLAGALGELGRLQHRNLGRRAAGLEALQESHALFERLARGDPDNRDLAAELAQSHDRLVSWYYDGHQAAEELQHLEKSLELWKRLAAADRRWERKVASASMNLGYYHHRRGTAPDALRCHGQSWEILQRLVRANPSDTGARAELRRACTNIGYVHLMHTLRYDEALRYFSQARTEAEHLARENPSVIDYQRQRAGAYNMLAQVQAAVGPVAAAEKWVRAAIATLEPVRAREPKNLDLTQELAFAYQLLTRYLNTPGQLQEVRELLLKSRDLFQANVAAAPDNKNYAMNLATAHRALGELQWRAGQRTEALQTLQPALAILEGNARGQGETVEDLNELASLYFTLAQIHREAGHRPEATAFFRKAFDVRKGQAIANPASSRAAMRLAEFSLPLAELLRADGKPREARQCVQLALEALEKGSNLPARDEYLRAELYAVLTGLVGPGNTDLTPEEQAERRRHADGAMAALERSVARGGRPTAATLRKNRYLQPLAGRPDFQQLVAKLEAAETGLKEVQGRLDRARRLLTDGDHARAVAETAAALESPYGTVVTLYNSACRYALASAAVRKDATLATADQEKLAGQYADRAVELLRQAVTKGYRSPANLDRLKGDKDLDALRGCPDFKTLVGDLEKALTAPATGDSN
jgi:serine/threonine-protein kinase